MSNEAKLGTIPKGNEGRDAVHVAIVPAQAEEKLESGEPIRINAKGRAERCNVCDAVGVVDPFRPADQRTVLHGEWFWLCLYPKTISGLRHVWDHPCFPKAEASPEMKLADLPSTSVAASQKWIADYVRKHCDYWSSEPDGGYSEFVRYVRDNRWIYYYGSDCHSLADVDDADELFRHLSVVLGMRIDAAYFEAFTCSC